MKLLVFSQLAALCAAFVLPNEQVFKDVQIESYNPIDSVREHVPSKSTLKHAFSELEESLEEAFDKLESISEYAVDEAKDFYSHTEDLSHAAIDDALTSATETGKAMKGCLQDTYFDTEAWVEAAAEKTPLKIADLEVSRPGHGHGGHHHHKPNMTVFELIAKSNYTTKLAKLISEYDDLVELLNGTSTNFTVFAPIDRAFDKIPKHAPKPSKEQIKRLLSYHVSADFYPAGRILGVRTIPSLLIEASLGDNPQRLVTNIGLRGLTVNFFSRVIAADIFATNGVIHGIDSIILPPPGAADILSFLPSEFSTLELGLLKTGLLEKINSTDHTGGTLFAPNNAAFSKLGPRLNGFLFSKYGEKYLAAILKFHVVANQTLYSDAFYKASTTDEESASKGPTKGVFHVDLPTLLEGRTLSIDIARYGRLIEIKINAFARVAAPDAVAADGVIHILENVLIPPKKLANGELDSYTGGEMSVEELKERLEPYVDDDDDAFWNEL